MVPNGITGVFSENKKAVNQMIYGFKFGTGGVCQWVGSISLGLFLCDLLLLKATVKNVRWNGILTAFSVYFFIKWHKVA